MIRRLHAGMDRSGAEQSRLRTPEFAFIREQNYRFDCVLQSADPGGTANSPTWKIPAVVTNSSKTVYGHYDSYATHELATNKAWSEASQPYLVSKAQQLPRPPNQLTQNIIK